MSEPELVTVVVPALNEQRSLGRCLDAVRGQSYRGLQIVVVDGGSTDDTLSVVRRSMADDDRIELLHSPRRNIPTSLNLALAQARGRWLVRVDAHSVIEPSHVESLVRRLADGSYGGVGGRKDGVGHTPAGRAIAAAMGSRFGVGNSVYHYGTEPQEVDHIPFGAYPVELVRRLGGWDERLSANEDFEFDYRLRRAGQKLLFDPTTTIQWECRQSIPELFAQYLRYGRGKVDVARLHPESTSVRHVLPPALVAYMVASALVSLRRPSRMLVANAPYCLGVAVASVRTGRHLGSVAERGRLPLAFATMHIAWGLGFWAQLLSSIRAAAQQRLGARSDAEGGTLGR